MNIGTKIKSLIFGTLALVLAISLAAVACAPAAPPEEAAAEEIAELEAALATSEKKVDALEDEVSDLEEDITALKKPAKVYYWEPASWADAGTVWDQLVYMGEWLDEMSDGRIKITPSAPGAVCPVEEQMEAVSTGATAMMSATPAYYAGKIPGAGIVACPPLEQNNAECMDLFEYFEDGALEKLYDGECERLYNIEVAGTYYFPSVTILSTSVPIHSAADLDGKKLRSGDESLAMPLTTLGASLVWFPGSEIYTSIATGLVDGFTYGSAYDHYANSFHEVAKYWISNPTLNVTGTGPIQVNRDVWNELSDDLKQMIITVIDATTIRLETETLINIDKHWAMAAAAGVEIIEWTAADCALYNKTRYEEMLTVAAEEPLAAEIMDIIDRWGKSKGYL